MSGTSPSPLDAFVERFAATLADMGLPRLAARVFAALLVSDEGRLTAAELATRLQASAGGVSGAVRYLLQVHLIGRERVPGTRRQVYTVDASWYEASMTLNPFLTRGAADLRVGVELLDGTPAGARLQETLQLIQFLKEEMRAMMVRWHERQRASGEAET